MLLECPSCGESVEFVVNDQCVHCGDEEIVDVVEQLRPDDEE